MSSDGDWRNGKIKDEKLLSRCDKVRYKNGSSERRKKSSNRANIGVFKAAKVKLGSIPT